MDVPGLNEASVTFSGAPKFERPECELLLSQDFYYL